MMMMLGLGGGGGYPKSPDTELSGDIAGSLNVLLTYPDDESDFSSEVLVKEEKLEEIMQELYREITSPYYYISPPTVTLTSPSSSSLSSSSPFPLSSPPFFGVSDVQSESCGASMSNSASTVMAGIEFVGHAGNFYDLKPGLTEAGNMGTVFDDHSHKSNTSNNDTNIVGRASDVEGLGEEEKMEGCDDEGGEVGDDQWLARVLGWGPLELDEWT